MCDIIKDKPRLEGIFIMILKRNREKGLKKRFLGWFFGFLILLFSLFGLLPGQTKMAYAEPEETASATCDDSLGSLGWLVCPTTGKVSEAVDFLYDKIEDVLVINPVELKDGSPVYEIWKYFQGTTNIVFVVFLLVVVLSQITGVGITNYGIKKALPKLILAAVLVNLSFYICSLAVDVSNIFGNGLRGLFESIASSVAVEGGAVSSDVAMAEMYAALSSGTALAVGGTVVAFETGAIWMLIPLALGALVSVVIGLITIAMRQAVVTLLIMIAPLAMVAYILPNTEVWFKKWRHLLFQMLVFYPAFSLLFGASSIAGWAIIVSANSGFAVLMGVAVQIFPLFFSWSLMKMSGTFLSAINAKLTSLASKPLAGAGAMANMYREYSRQKHLAQKDAYTPSLRLQQFLSDRKISISEETNDYAETVKKRGLAYAAMRNYQKDGETPSREGEESYEAQARNAEYDRKVLRHKNNMNKGMGQLEALKKNGTRAQKARLNALDSANVQAFDKLKMEQARGEVIDYRNAIGFHNRMEAAMNSHMDAIHGETVDAEGRRINNLSYKRHFEPGSLEATEASLRYADLTKIMEGDVLAEHYADATAAHAYDTQNKIVATKMQKYFELAPPTQDVVYRLNELTQIASDTEMRVKAAESIDTIIAGLRVLNQRGDTDLVKAQIDNLLDKNIGGGIQLGTHASQALASFLMFEVKDNDPFLRRFGKYINLETARAYNNNERKILDLTYDEYIKGYHDGEPDIIAKGDASGRMYAKKDMIKLTEGTSLDNIERTAFSNLDDSLKKAYGFDPTDINKAWDVDGWIKKRESIQTAFEPAFLSASLKWLSGSEQINSAVKFWTGYDQSLKAAWSKGMKDGNEVSKFVGFEKDEQGNIVGERDYSDDVQRYFRRKTNDYFKDQTTGQILGMRTDYRDATMEHLVDTYLKGLKSEDEMTDAERMEFEKRQAEFKKQEAEIQTRYGDEDATVAHEKRKQDLKALKMEIAGKQVRKIMGETGKLGQIYTTRTSGTAINAKDWLRRWLNLDNEAELRREKNFYDREMRKKFKAEKSNNTGGDEGLKNKIYVDGCQVEYDAMLSKIKDENRNEAPVDFYKKTREKLCEWFGENELMVWKYDHYFKPSMTNADLYNYLKELIADIENYPGNY